MATDPTKRTVREPHLHPLIAVAILAVTVAGSSGCGGPAEGSVLRDQVATVAAVPAAATSSGMAAVRLRRLWTGEEPDFWASSPSPDGRYVTEIDYTTGNLAVIDLGTGTLYPLTDKQSWLESNDLAGPSMFSPDGRRVVYAWYHADGEKEYDEIRVLDFTVDTAGVPHGSHVRLVHRPGPILAYELYGWLSDDQVLTGITRPDKTTALASLSLSTDSVRVLKSFGWDGWRAVLSPDRRYVAFDSPAATGSEGDHDIGLISIDGTEERTLVEKSGDVAVLGWVPGDGSLLYYSDRSGNPSIWQLPMADGKPAGPARLVRDDLRGVEPLGFAGDEFYFGVEVEKASYRAARIDFDHGRVERLPTRFEVSSGGQVLAWSPTGEYLVHVGQQGKEVSLLNAQGKVLRRWTFDLRINRYTVKWMPDASAVLLPGSDAKGRQGFIRINLASGSLEMVRRFIPPGETGRELSISPDGRTMYFLRRRIHDDEFDDSVADLVAHDFETGVERVVRPVPFGVGNLAGSPDGAWIAQSIGGQTVPATIHLIPIDGGDTRVVARFEPRLEGNGEHIGIVGWAPDSRSLLFLRAPVDRGAGSARSTPVELWRAYVDGREAHRVAVVPDYAGGLTLHPDGRTIAYRSGATRGEIWALDGLTTTAASGTAGKGDAR